MTTTSPHENELAAPHEGHDPRASWRDVLCAWLVLVLFSVAALLL